MERKILISLLPFIRHLGKLVFPFAHQEMLAAKRIRQSRNEKRECKRIDFLAR